MATGASHRTAATCTVGARNNLGFSGSGQGIGTTHCDNNAPCMTPDTKFISASTGQILQEGKAYSPFCGYWGDREWATNMRYCYGAYVYTNFYDNIGGVGKSFTTSQQLCY
jgi:hypothetical protein